MELSGHDGNGAQGVRRLVRCEVGGRRASMDFASQCPARSHSIVTMRRLALAFAGAMKGSGGREERGKVDWRVAL